MMNYSFNDLLAQSRIPDVDDGAVVFDRVKAKAGHSHPSNASHAPRDGQLCFGLGTVRVGFVAENKYFKSNVIKIF